MCEYHAIGKPGDTAAPKRPFAITVYFGIGCYLHNRRIQRLQKASPQTCQPRFIKAGRANDVAFNFWVMDNFLHFDFAIAA